MRAKNEIREKENFLSDRTRKKQTYRVSKNRLKSTPTIFATRFFCRFFFGRFQIVFWKRPKFLEVDEMEWRQQKSFFQKFLAKSKNLQFGFRLLLKQTHNWTFFSWPFWSWCQLDTQLQHFNACKNFFLLRFAFQLLKNCAQQFRNNFVRCNDGLPENDAAAFKINFWNNDFHLMEVFFISLHSKAISLW